MSATACPLPPPASFSSPCALFPTPLPSKRAPHGDRDNGDDPLHARPHGDRYNGDDPFTRALSPTHDPTLLRAHARPQCLFAMLAGFFPLDEASGSDWRFGRVRQAASAGQSACHTIYGFYERPCDLSKEASELIDVLRVLPTDRMSVQEVLARRGSRTCPSRPPPRMQSPERMTSGRTTAARRTA